MTAPPLSAMRERPRPWSVRVSFWLWFAGAALAVVAAALVARRLDEVRAAFVREAKANDPTATGDTIEQVADLSVLVVVGGGVVVGVLAVLVAVAMRAGRNWARALLVVVAVAAVGWAVLVLTPAGPLAAAAAVAMVAATVVMYLPGSRSWYL
jgi:hypothetical protein